MNYTTQMTSCCTRWTLGGTTALLLFLALVKLHSSWIIQSKYERVLFNTVRCTEMEFQFKTSNKSIFSDTDVFEKCGVNSSTYTRGAFNDDDAQNPLLGTKCGIQKTKLLSFYKPGAPSYIGASNIPNIVHYIYFGKWNTTFLEYLSFRSADQFLKPKYIFIHGDGNFVGNKWWNKIKKEIAKVFWVPRTKPLLMQGVPITAETHGSNIIRIQTLQDNGGIYLDTDSLALQSFEPLTKYDFTIGRPAPISLANSIMISKPNIPFFCVWLESYRKYNPIGTGNSVKMASQLAKVLPNLVHIEERSLVRPSWTSEGELGLMFDKHYDWSHNYAMHIWKRLRKVPTKPSEIDQFNCTLGEVMRYVYYGSKDMRIPV